MNKKPLLSICIPTYNRDYLLDKMLKKLVPLAKENNIPIYISDNASPDSTQSVVNKYITTCIIYYKKQSHNIGPDKNYEYLLKNSQSKYKWLLSDSTVINYDDLKKLLNFLRTTNEDFIVVGVKGRTSCYVSKKYENPNEILLHLGWHMTYVSCLIYNEKIINNLSYERYYDSRFLQTGIIFEYLAVNKSSVYFYNDLKLDSISIEKRDHWNNIPFEVFSRDWYLFIMSLPIYYSYESKITCIKMHGISSGLFSLKNLFIFRAKKYLSFAIYYKYKFFIQQTVKYKFLCFSVCFIPSYILYLLYNLIKKIKRVSYHRLHVV